MLSGSKLLRVLLIVIILACSGCDDAQNRRELAAYDDSMLSNEEVEVLIEAGMNVSQIGALLVKEGVIADAEIFRYYTTNRGFAARLQAGLYKFNKGMSVVSATAMIVDGDVYIPRYVFSLPEGSNIRQIAIAAERQGFCSEEEFLMAVEHSTLRSAEPGVMFPLEGYLYPATYTWSWNLTAEELLEEFYSEAIWRYEAYEVPEDHPLSFEEIIILASLLEKESQYDNEREVVAGVFLNRLKLGMPLQSCATVNYILPEFKDVLTYDDIAIDSPYNTYIIDGLPIGPISSPGDLAIRAVLYPAETDYLFFVVSEDGTHIFSRTYEEHEAAAAWLGG